MQSYGPLGAAGGGVEPEVRAGAAVAPPRFARPAASIAAAKSPAARVRLHEILALPLLVAALAAGLLASQTSAPDRPLNTAAGAVTLSDDDSGSAMFNLANLAPGDTASRCALVTYGGEAPADVTLRGATAGSGLAEHLDLKVEEGSGGGFAACDGFEGRTIFQGTLAEFAGTHHSHESGLPASLGRDGAETGTFRFTIAQRDTEAAQGHTATASFTWEAQGDVSAGEPSAPTPTDGATPEADSSPPVGSQRADSSPPTAGPTARSRADRPGKRRRGRSGPDRPGRQDPAGGRGAEASSDGLGDALLGALKAALPALQRAAFPGLLLLVMLLFLWFQNRIDRNDPKLALAPINDEPYAAFVPLDGEGAGL